MLRFTKAKKLDPSKLVQSSISNKEEGKEEFDSSGDEISEDAVDEGLNPENQQLDPTSVKILGHL